MRTLMVTLLSFAVLAQSVAGAALPRDIIRRETVAHFPHGNESFIASTIVNTDSDVCTTCATPTREVFTWASISTSTLPSIQSFTSISTSTTLILTSITTSSPTSSSTSPSSSPLIEHTSISTLSLIPNNVDIESQSPDSSRIGLQSHQKSDILETHPAQSNRLPPTTLFQSFKDSPSAPFTTAAGTESKTRPLRNTARLSRKVENPWTIPSRNVTTTKQCPSTNCGWIPSITPTYNTTQASGTLTVVPPTSTEPCIFPGEDEPVTEYSIIYTATVTFYGNSSDYTPPFPTIRTPNYCHLSSKLPSRTGTPDPAPITATAPELGSGVGAMPTESKVTASAAESEVDKEGPPGFGQPTITRRPHEGAHSDPDRTRTLNRPKPTVTFVTTDKNPAVVFTSEPPPHFNRPPNSRPGFVTRNHGPVSSDIGRADDTTVKLEANEGNGLDTISRVGRVGQSATSGTVDQETGHSTTQSGNAAKSTGSVDGSDSSNGADETDNFQTDKRPSDKKDPSSEPATTEESIRSTRQSLYLVATKTFSVTARAGEVVVNSETFTDLVSPKTTTITVDNGIFTISSSIIKGEGVTITKPRATKTIVSVVGSTSTVFGTVTVVVSGTEAVVAGTAVKIPAVGTTTSVGEKSVVVEPGKVVVDDQTLSFSAEGGPQTGVVVEGGEIVTAVGKSVYIFHSTTLTYGPGIPETSQVVDDDTVTIAPSGIIIRGKTMGGSSAAETDTRQEIVGGATITKVSPSYVIIDGTTFTAGPGAKRTTKAIGGETVTVRSDGVIVSTLTIKVPFGESTVTTFTRTKTITDDVPVETAATNNGKKEDSDGQVSTKGNGEEEDDSAGSIYQPSYLVGWTGFCIIIGVLFWV